MKLSASQEEFVINGVSENARDPCQSIPVSAVDVSLASKSDREIASVMQFVQHGWPSNINESLAPYHRCRDELTLEAGCYVRGYRTVTPAALQQTVLGDLHAVHVAVVRMKGMARFFSCGLELTNTSNNWLPDAVNVRSYRMLRIKKSSSTDLPILALRASPYRLCRVSRTALSAHGCVL